MRLSRLLIPALLWLTTACDDGIATTESANITLNPAAQMTFNRVGEGQTKALQVRVQHSGDIPFNITGMYITQPGLDQPNGCDLGQYGLSAGAQLPPEMADCVFFIETRPQWPKQLDEAQFIDVDIRYRQLGPDAPSPMELVVLHDIVSLRHEPKRISLVVQSGVPQLSVNRTTIAFPPGVGGSELVTFHNLGTAPLRIERVYMRHISGTVTDPRTGEARAFFRFQSPPDTPWDVDQDESESLTVIYEPDPANGETAISELIIESNDYTNGHCAAAVETRCASAAQCAAGDRCVGEQTVRITSEEVQGILQIEPNPLVFGVVQAPNMLEKKVNILNVGLRSVDVLGITIEQPSEEYSLGGEQTSFRLQGAGSRQITVRYQPRSVEGSDAVLVIDTGRDQPADNADDEGKFRVDLVRTGDTLPPSMSVNPLVVDLSTTARGETGKAIVTVSNPGGAPLSLTRVALSGEADVGLLATDPEFQITAGGAPMSLAPADTHEIEISFTRPAEGNAVYAGTLIVESAEAGQKTVSLAASPPRE
ncbi:choice-of-anchor D domain-containing protein [Myxococcota bacterium]|nr:choice-of-anchor D domain-containing protein [Myxococcota bacterium]MBU1900250.1 choice-of-anchor D domain-containing protein [Myxococcota bacterium]